MQGNDSGTTDWSEEATFTTIDGTDITLYDSGTDAEGNTTTISSYDGQKVNVTISGRTLYKDGNWNTLCLPFDVSAAQIAIEGHPLHGATIMELNVDDKWTMDNGQWIVDNENGTYQTGFKDGTLYLYFKDASKIKAGVPYIVKWKTTGSDIENPWCPRLRPELRRRRSHWNYFDNEFNELHEFGWRRMVRYRRAQAQRQTDEERSVYP